MDTTSAGQQLDGGDDDDEPVYELESHTDDLWSLAPKSGAAVEPGAAIALPFEMFDAELSLRLSNDPDALWAFWEQNRDKYPRVSDVNMRIDLGAAAALEQQLWQQVARQREEALERIRTAPKHSGLRQDGDLLRHLVQNNPKVLSHRRKQVFELCIERGFSVNQCAEALGIGMETVRTHLRRLRALAPAAWRQPRG